MMTIKEYALKILHDHDCDEHTYYGDDTDLITRDLKTAYPNGMEFPHEDVAAAIREISKPSLDQVPQTGFDFDDWGKWGIGDFSEDQEKELRAAIESGKPFNTGWHGWRDEEYSMCIVRNEDHTQIKVIDCMDEAFEQEDLFYDFLEDDELDMLTDDKLEEIRECLCDGDFAEEAFEESMLPADATYDDIISEAIKLVEACRERLNESFKVAISTTLIVLYGYSAEDTMRKIEERIAKYA